MGCYNNHREEGVIFAVFMPVTAVLAATSYYVG